MLIIYIVRAEGLSNIAECEWCSMKIEINFMKEAS